MTRRTAFLSRGRFPLILAGTGILLFLWGIAALVSARPWEESLVVVVTQTLLSFLALMFLFKAMPNLRSAYGPGLMLVLAVHVLLFYGISNVVPALLPEWRSDTVLFDRVSQSPAGAYALAGIAASLLLLGFAVGNKIVKMLVPLLATPFRAKNRLVRYIWMPEYRICIVVCVVLVGLVMLGTTLFALSLNVLLTGEVWENFFLSQQLFFYGLFGFLPLAPLLAAMAYLQAENARQKQLALKLIIISSVIVITALFVWRSRGFAMLVVLLPICLLIYTGKLAPRRAIVLGMVLVSLVYLVVTTVRISDLEILLATNDQSELSPYEIFDAIRSQSRRETVLTRFQFDISYRTAGLEAVAALIQAQNRGEIEPKWGRVIWSGFLQAVPAALRPESEILERVKTAPIYYGIFGQGDWVATILAEFILDFGPVLLFFPAVVAGLCFSLIDRILLSLGVRPALQGLLILRIPWLLFFIIYGSSVADMTLLFFKATIGYAGLFLLIGWMTNIHFRRVHRHFSQPHGIY